MKEQQSALRLRKKHGDGARPQATAADGRRILNAQSLRSAVMAGLITIIVFSFVWILVTDRFGTVFPWATVLLGYLLGQAIQRTGRGVEWQFPALAAVMALLGSIGANIVLAASGRAEQMGTSTMFVLQSLSTYTLPDFFRETWNMGDTFFALMAAALAAFYAQRRLTREQYFAIRLWREENEGE